MNFMQGLSKLSMVILVSAVAAASVPAFCRADGEFAPGALPFSNQWKFEKPQSLIYFALDSQTLKKSGYTKGDFDISLKSKSLYLYGFNFLAKALTLRESSDARRSVALWGKVTVEGALTNTALSSASTPLSSASSEGSLFAGRLGAGPVLEWDSDLFLQPYAGFEFWTYLYRHSGSLTSVDFGGKGWMLEPLVGTHIRIRPPFSALLQLGFNQPLGDAENSFFAKSTSVTIGLGVGL